MMSRSAASFLCSAFLLCTAATSAFAQNDDSDSGTANVARLDVKLAQLEEQVRRMEGAIEQLSFENKQLKTQAEKSNGDIQYRLQALETKQSATPAAAPAPQAVGTPPSDQLQPVAGASGDNGDAPAAAPAEQFANSRDHYNHAFRLMQQAQYAEAGSSFASFTKTYPHDPLVGNAYYWLGETFYVRRDYPQAADNFRQGYESMPSGPKAGDNLLKLAMSLDAMKKDTEACVVLKQVVTKYGSGSSSVKPRAEQEINRIGCN